MLLRVVIAFSPVVGTVAKALALALRVTFLQVCRWVLSDSARLWFVVIATMLRLSLWIVTLVMRQMIGTDRRHSELAQVSHRAASHSQLTCRFTSSHVTWVQKLKGPFSLYSLLSYLF